MDATTGATIVASVINSSSLNCNSSSSSNSSSGYGSSHSAASTPIGSQYEAAAHTPVSAPAEHVPPTATVAPVTPCYSETALAQQQRQQYYQSYAYANPAGQYPIYDAFTGNSYHNLTTPSVERSLGTGSGSGSVSGSSAANSHLSSQQQRIEKSSKSAASSGGTQLYTSSANASLTTTTSSSSKPQATATPFFAQPSSNVSGSSAAYYDAYGKYKMPSSTKLSSHAATDYASHLQHAVASLSYQHQQQHYYAAAKSQLQDANYAAAVKPHRQHSVNNASAYYGNSGAYYDKYEKYMYPAAASGAAYATAAPTHASHPYSPHEPTTADPYRKVAAAAAANAWHWNMEYAAGSCRSLPPTAAGSSYLAAAGTAGSTRDAFCAAPNEKYSKYDKYSAYYANAHHQQYMTPQSSAATSRNLWPNTAHHTSHLAGVQHGLNERLTHTLAPAAAQHQYPHTHPSHHHFASAPTAAGTAQRQSCCAQPFQQQSCYYPRPSQQHAHTNATNPYAPPQQSHYGTGGSSTASGSHKYGAYSSSFKSNSSSNDLFVTSPFETSPPPAYNYGAASASSLQSRYGATNAAYYNDLNMQTAFDGFANTAMSQPPMLQQHNVAAHSTHLGYQAHGSSQNPSTSALLDYRKPTSATNEYCLNKSRAPPLTGMEQHIGPTGYLTFDMHGTPIAQAHSVISSPTIYSDGGSSSEKSTPTTKNIRDFLATWSEGEDEESAAAASAAEQLSFVEGAPVQLRSRSYGMSESAGAHEVQQDQHGYKSANSAANRRKVHVGITVDGSLDVDSSQFINLPDIIIDIEKSNTAAPASASNAAAPGEAPNEAVPARPSSPLMEHHSPCGGHEIFENFDVEKELDELQIKRAKLCLEKQLNNEIRILTPEPIESPACDATTKPSEQPTPLYQNLNTVQHSDCEKSYERADTFLKEMELNDSTSHSSNGSTFEKEYETFINRIESDKIDVDRPHRICNETDTNATQLPIMNEDSGSVSHQSSGIKTPPDPTDIDELAQKACQSGKPLDFSGNPDFETRELEDFTDCVQDLTTHATLGSSQKSMDESMVLQNFEGPTQEIVVIPDSTASTTKPLKASQNLSESLINEAEDLSLSRDGLAEEKNSSSNLDKDCSNLESPISKTPPEADDIQNHEDFSIFYKKKRKIVQEFQENESVHTPSKQSRSKEDENVSTFATTEATFDMEAKTTSSKLSIKSKTALKPKRHATSFFYKNLRYLSKVRKLKTAALVQQHLALLKERHLPLIKRQSIKNFSACSRLVFNPRSLKCLTVSMVNTNEFQNHLLDELDKTQPKSEENHFKPAESIEIVQIENRTETKLNEEVAENDTIAKPLLCSEEKSSEHFEETEAQNKSLEMEIPEKSEQSKSCENELIAEELTFNENVGSAELDSNLEIETNRETKPEPSTDLTDIKTIECTEISEPLSNIQINEEGKTEQSESSSCSESVETENSEICKPSSSPVNESTKITTEASTIDPESEMNSNDKLESNDFDNSTNIHSVKCIEESKPDKTEVALISEISTSFESTESQTCADLDTVECAQEVETENSLEANAVTPRENSKEDNLKDVLEEQSSATISENWSTSLKAQEEFEGFEDENSSKQNLNTSSNSVNASLDSSTEFKENKLQAEAVTIKEDPKNESLSSAAEMNATLDSAKITPAETLITAEESASAVVAESASNDFNEQLEESTNEIGSPSKAETKPSTEYNLISDSESEPETVTKITPTIETKVPNLKESSEITEQTTPLPPMRTKASVKMCDFSDTRLKRKWYRERSKSKSLGSLKSIKRNKRSHRSLDAQNQPATTDINQKPKLEGIGKIDKAKFVANWAASVSAAKKPQPLFGCKSRTMRADSTEALDLSPTSRLPPKTSPIQLDEDSNASSASSRSSSSSASSCDNKSQTSSNSSSSQTTQSNTSTTSSTSQSSSSDSSTDGSDFNEMKALERELSQHKTHDDWANSVAQICEAETHDATKTDKIKLEIFETEATNQDIADLKKILESEENTTDEMLPTGEAQVCAEAAEVRVKGQIAGLKDIAEELITRQATNMRENDKLREEERSSEAASKLQEQEQPQQENVIPKLSDLCKIALNSSFVINELSVSHNENEKQKELEQVAQENQKRHHKENITPPNSPKSTNEASQQPQNREQPAMTVEEELAEMYRQAGVVSDPEDNCDEGGLVAGENYTENHAQDYLLINLAEILANSDHESNVFVLQCDMNENVLRVMTTSPSSDNSNELVIGEVANVDVESGSAVQIVQLVNADNLHVAAGHHVETAPPPPPTRDNVAMANPLEQYIIDNDGNNDLPIIHHEEIVPDNYKKYEKEQLLKYLHAKYVQKHVRRFYHAHRISKKYRRRYLSKKVSNLLAAAAQRPRS